MLSNTVTCWRPETNETTLSPSPAMKQVMNSVVISPLGFAVTRSRGASAARPRDCATAQPSAPLAAARRVRRVHVGDQPLHQLPVLDDRAEPHEAVARLLVLRDLQQRLAQRPVDRELLRPLDQPEIEAVVELVPRLRRQRRVVFEIVDEVSRVDAEEPRQQQARAARQMRAGAALELREIGLADPAVEFLS